MSQIINLKLLLEKSINFLNRFSAIANSHMVDFITDDHWNKLVNEDIRNELETFGIEEFEKCFRNIKSNMLAFKAFLVSAKEHTLDSYKGDFILNKKEIFESYSECFNDVVLDGLNGCSGAMTEKKIHEVKTMSGLIIGLAKTINNDGIVDLGGGKGYLTSILALHHHLNVLSLDSSVSNTIGAEKRFLKLQVYTLSILYLIDVLL